VELQAKTQNIAIEIKNQKKVTLTFQESILASEAQLSQQCLRIGLLEDEIGRIK